MPKLAVALVLCLAAAAAALADPPAEKREDADLIVVGRVSAVYARDTLGYRDYIVEVRVTLVPKGKGIKSGDTFRAFCYKAKPGAKLNPDFDSAGHSAVPREGQRVRLFVNKADGRNVGVYPDWFDILPPYPRKPKKP